MLLYAAITPSLLRRCPPCAAIRIISLRYVLNGPCLMMMLIDACRFLYFAAFDFARF